MHYTQDYSRYTDRRERDEAAIRDAADYVGPERWAKLTTLAVNTKTPKEASLLSFALCFAGVRGYPVQAIMRRYCLSTFREWLREEGCDVATDEEGFPL